MGTARNVLKTNGNRGGLFQRLEKFPVAFHAAGQFFHADRGQRFPLGLAHIKDGNDLKGRNLYFLYFGNRLSVLSHHRPALCVQLLHFLFRLERGRGQYLDGLFAFLYIAVKTVPPLVVARHKLSALHGDQEGVVEAVTVELGHSGEIGFVAFTLEKLLCAGFQPVGDLFHALGAVLAVKENGGDRLRGLCRRCRLRLHLAFLPQNFRRGIGHHPVFLRHRLALMDALPFVAAFYQIAIIGKNTMLCVGNMQAKTGQENPSFPFLRHIHHAGTV